MFLRLWTRAPRTRSTSCCSMVGGMVSVVANGKPSQRAQRTLPKPQSIRLLREAGKFGRNRPNSGVWLASRTACVAQPHGLSCINHPPGRDKLRSSHGGVSCGVKQRTAKQELPVVHLLPSNFQTQLHKRSSLPPRSRYVRVSRLKGKSPEKGIFAWMGSSREMSPWQAGLSR